MASHSDHRIAQLLGSLAPAPGALVRRAQAIPSEHPALGEVVVRAETDAAFRTELAEDMQGALERSGYASDPALLEILRGHLGLGGG